MKTKKKSRFLTFCFSLLPGAGEMYMGFMRMGLSLMLLFILSFMIPAALRLDELSVLALVVWFYGFFHANHLVSLTDEEFAKVEDEYLFGMDSIAGGRNFVNKYRKGLAVVLIASGVLLLWPIPTSGGLRCHAYRRKLCAQNAGGRCHHFYRCQDDTGKKRAAGRSGAEGRGKRYRKQGGIKDG